MLQNCSPRVRIAVSSTFFCRYRIYARDDLLNSARIYNILRFSISFFKPQTRRARNSSFIRRQRPLSRAIRFYRGCDGFQTYISISYIISRLTFPFSCQHVFVFILFAIPQQSHKTDYAYRF